jgi:hypothetical protein
VASHEIEVVGESWARKAGVFMTLVGLAGPLLKRCWEYTVPTDLRIYGSKEIAVSAWLLGGDCHVIRVLFEIVGNSIEVIGVVSASP